MLAARVEKLEVGDHSIRNSSNNNNKQYQV